MASRAVSVEIIAYAPTVFYHCLHCEVVWQEAESFPKIHQEQIVASLPNDLIQEYQTISDWIVEISQRYSDQICIRVTDVASIEGFIRSLRYGVHRYPAVIIDGHARFSDDGLSRAEDEIQRRIQIKEDEEGGQDPPKRGNSGI